MNALENYTEEDSELVFGYRTIFVPGRSIEIGFSVRKKSGFPLVEELILKFLNAGGDASLDDLVSFLDFPAKELLGILQPLLGKGLIVRSESGFSLSEFGKALFSGPEDGTPAITESESRVNRFTIDDQCALPAFVPDFSEHRADAKGQLKRLISDQPPSPTEGDTVITRAVRNFALHFAHFIRNEGELEKIREEQLEHHKTEYAKTKTSFVIQADVQGVIQKNGIVANRVLPFDTLTAKTESRMLMRAALIEAAKTPPGVGTTGEIEFLRACFGEDFLEGIALNSPLPWFKVIPKFFGSKIRTKLQSGDELVIGELCVPRNVLQVERMLQQVSSGKEFSPEAPLRITWLRPSVESWGRSIAFLEGIKALREIAKNLRKGAVVIELWENRHWHSNELKPELKSYWPWFDDIRYFRSDAIPSKMEMVLVGESCGFAVTHAFTPLQACFPCPVGVQFHRNENVSKIIDLDIEPKLRSLPTPVKKTKVKSKKSNSTGIKGQA
jgi:hypothetical protein